MRVFCAVPQLPNAIMGSLHLFVLPLNDFVRLRIHVRFAQGGPVGLGGGVFPTLAFGQQRVGFGGLDGFRQSHPRPMESTSDGPLLGRSAAQRPYSILQLEDEFLPLQRVALEQLHKFRRFDPIGCTLVTLLGVSARQNQFLQHE